MTAQHRATALVVGVTGVQGSATARELLDAGWLVRGLTRRPGARRAHPLADAGVELVEGDLDDRRSLEEAIAGVDGVHLVTSMDPRTYDAEAEVRQATRLIDMLAAADGPHLVFSSVAAAKDVTGVAHVDSKGIIEDHIHELGLPATILRPSIFMDNLVRPGVAAGYWRLAPTIIGWDRMLPWIAASDIGRIAARVLGDPRPWRGRTLELTADRRSLGEARDAYRCILGRRPFRMPISVSMFRRLVGEELVDMWRWQARADLGAFSPGAADITGLLDLETWLRQHANGAGGRGSPGRVDALELRSHDGHGA